MRTYRMVLFFWLIMIGGCGAALIQPGVNCTFHYMNDRKGSDYGALTLILTPEDIEHRQSQEQLWHNFDIHILLAGDQFFLSILTPQQQAFNNNLKLSKYPYDNVFEDSFTGFVSVPAGNDGDTLEYSCAWIQ